MFGVYESEWRRTLVAGLGALALSSSLIGATVVPTEPSQACLLVPADAGDDQVLCSLA